MLLEAIAADGVAAAPSSFQHAVALALAVGASRDEIVATLEAVTPVRGPRASFSARPRSAFALGYDVDAALELRDP